MNKHLKKEDLKVGMEVAYQEGNWIGSWWVVGKIEKISPTGQKVVINGVSIDTRIYFLYEVTDNIRNEIVRYNAEKKCFKMVNALDKFTTTEKIRKLDNEKLEKLNGMLTELLGFDWGD